MYASKLCRAIYNLPGDNATEILGEWVVDRGWGAGFVAPSPAHPSASAGPLSAPAPSTAGRPAPAVGLGSATTVVAPRVA